MKYFRRRFGRQPMSRIVAVAILLGVLTLPPSTVGATVTQDDDARDMPYVKFINPTIGACLSSNEDLQVAWILVVPGHESGAAAFRMKHEHSEVCVAFGSEGAESCVKALSNSEIWHKGYFPEGCHTLVGWLRDANGRPGVVMSVPFSVGPNCSSACNPRGAAEVGVAGDVTSFNSGAANAASAQGSFALGFPPNAVTGGCLKNGNTDSAGSPGFGCRCNEGCCEAGSPLSMCEHASFVRWRNSTAAAEGESSEAKSGAYGSMARLKHRKRLPHCSECLPEVTPPDRALLPRFSAGGAPLVRRYLDTVKATVLNSAYTNFNDADFDSLQALTMVGGRRIDHLDALIQDVLYRGVPGDFIECGCWRGGVGLFAAAAFEAYATAAASISALVSPFATNAGRHSGSGGGTSGNMPPSAEMQEGGGLGGGLRRVWLADSFSGLPPVDTGAFPADAAHKGSDDIQLLKANSVEHVERAAAALQLSHRTHILPGFFNESLPAALATAATSTTAEEEKGGSSSEGGGGGGSDGGSSIRGVLPAKEGTLAILRLDGDLYQSTLESLHYLYPLLSVGGHVVVDDFTDWDGCRNAVMDYRHAHGLTEPLQITWHAFGDDVGKGELTRGIWWTKSTSGPKNTLTPGSEEGTNSVAYAGGTVHLPLLAVLSHQGVS